MHPKFRIKPSFWLYLLLFSYWNPHGLFWPFVAAAALHELAHLAAVVLFGGSVRSVCLGFADARMETSPLPLHRELFCLAAGPGCNFFCAVVFSKAFSAFAAISFLLFLYNSLPVFPLDGGRVLKILLSLRYPDMLTERISEITSAAICCIFLLAAVFGSIFCALGVLPIFCAALFAGRILLLQNPVAFLRQKQ